MSKNIYLIIFLLYIFTDVFSQENKPTENWQIDSIAIHKNWRTKDKIILEELLFSIGDTVSEETLNRSISRIWNTGNFASVSYSVDSVSLTNHVLILTTKDAFNLVPYVTISGNKDDKKVSMGFSDENFLGRNINLGLNGSIGTYKSSYKLSVGIPRQLLHKNMTLSFLASGSTGNNFRYKNNKKVSAIAYHAKQFSGNVGNPWHTDYKYTFSPNFGWNLFQHKTDTSLIDTDIPLVADYTVNYLALSVSESIGLINRIRHQHNGYSISASYTAGIGLDKNSPAYHEFDFGASYYNTLNRVVELAASFSTGYTTSTLPSLLHYLNSNDVKGIVNGQESGKGSYNIKLNGGFTYLYYSWFALEHSIYTHFGMANDRYFYMYRRKPRVSLGTKIRIWTPVIPWLAASIHFTYVKGNNNWFHLDI
ncbi:BamA/TamA family outer membrane protein [Draconibacterium sediminis]|uniref:Bacterial surface antigen (D15) domain-containing protein n=1 Tax=Draconibacterium sediminis TaxID=1544798 RepID=A0A0D8JAF0_9BACT|nr:BamA/TamA family outer membrane protein [Draconibacterium sediminis]KJF43980.1 hypothetical protein LH29_00045 [Draconibacterium sediminis]